jgi:uncharacterized RDD family membrane protein YckC
MRYFYSDQNNRPVGPVTADEVLTLYRVGTLNARTPLIAEGETTWATVDTLLRPTRAMMPAYTPPAVPTCRSCGVVLQPNVSWCPVCDMSTRDFVDARLASPLRRIAAGFVGQLIPSSLGIVFAVRAMGGRSGAIASLAFLAYGMWACVLYTRGTTPGKHLLGLEVLDEDGDPAGFWRMIGREWFAKILSAMVLGLGFLWILIDKDRQGWHDKLAGTYVVKRGEGAG